MIDQADQAEPLGNRHDIRRQQHLSVILFHPHQAFVERRPPRSRLDHRLVGHHDPPLVERGNDLVGDADIDAALGFAFDIRPPHRIRSGAAALGTVERLVGAVNRLIGVARAEACFEPCERPTIFRIAREIVAKHLLRVRRLASGNQLEAEGLAHRVVPRRSSGSGRTCCRRSGRTRRRRAAGRGCGLRPPRSRHRRHRSRRRH